MSNLRCHGTAGFPRARLAAAAREDVCPACWGGQQAVVALPERLGVAKAGQVRAELLAVVDRGAAELIADMTATIFCDHAGQDGVARTISRHRHAGPADGPGWLGSAAGMAVRDVHVAHAGEHDRDA